MAVSEQLRKGMVIRYQDELFVVQDFSTAQSGKQKPTVHVKLRSLKSGHVGERTVDQLGKIDEVATEVRSMQYLYSSGHQRVFMDTESFEQYSLGEDVLGNGVPFLVEEEVYRFLVAEGKVVALQLPPSVVLEVVDTAPVEHAGSGSNVYKEAKLASGLVIKLPLFIKNGDKVRVSTDKREYLGKEH